jgi:hypothetical protein
VQTTIMMDVEPPKRQPQKLIVGYTGSSWTSTPFISLSLADSERFSLQVSALYDGLDQVVRIAPAFVVFKTRTEKNVPVVRIDETTGVLTPLHVGYALVESSFGGRTNLTCVFVEEHRYSPDYRSSRCEELRQSDEKLQGSLQGVVNRRERNSRSE